MRTTLPCQADYLAPLASADIPPCTLRLALRPILNSEGLAEPVKPTGGRHGHAQKLIPRFGNDLLSDSTSGCSMVGVPVHSLG